MTEKQNDNSITPNKPRPTLGKRILKWCACSFLLFLLWLLLGWFFATPVVINGHQLISRDAVGQFKIDYKGQWLSKLFPEISLGNIKLKYDASSITSFEQIPESTYLATRRIWFINRSDHPLTNQVATQLIKQLAEWKSLQEIEYFPKGTQPDPDAREPDLYFELDLKTNTATSKPEALPFTGDILLRISTNLARTPALGNTNKERWLTTYDRRFNFNFSLTNIGIFSPDSHYRKLAQNVSETLFHRLEWDLLSLSTLNSQFSEIPEVYFPDKQAPPDYQFIQHLQTKPVAQTHGFLKPNETLWLFQAAPEKQAQFIKQAEKELTLQGWTRHPNAELLKMKKGRDLIQIVRWNENFPLQDLENKLVPIHERGEGWHGQSPTHHFNESNTHAWLDESYLQFQTGKWFKMKAAPLRRFNSKTIPRDPQSIRKFGGTSENNKPFRIDNKQASQFWIKGKSSGDSRDGVSEEQLTDLEAGQEQLAESFSLDSIDSNHTTDRHTYLIHYLNLTEEEDLQQIIVDRFNAQAPLKELFLFQKEWSPEQTTEFLKRLDQSEKKTAADWFWFAKLRTRDEWRNDQLALDAAKRAYLLSLKDPDPKDDIKHQAERIYEKITKLDIFIHSNHISHHIDDQLFEEMGIHVCKLEDFPVTLNINLNENCCVVIKENEMEQVEFHTWAIRKNQQTGNKHYYNHREIHYVSQSGHGEIVRKFPHTDGDNRSGNSEGYSYQSKSKYTVDKTDDPQVFTLTLNRDVKVKKNNY